jgi:diamine N-acetyltransferase
MKKAPHGAFFVVRAAQAISITGMNTTTYRWMTNADVGELGALARRIWNAHYPGKIITQAQTDFMVVKSYSPEALTQQLADGQKFLLAIQQQKIIGFLSVHHLTHIKEPILRGANVSDSDYYLHKFYIAQEVQGQGIGKSLLNELVVRIPEIKRLRLQVARKNVDSWNFYLKQGFAIEQEADFDIGDGFIMADYVMEKLVA